MIGKNVKIANFRTVTSALMVAISSLSFRMSCFVARLSWIGIAAAAARA